MHDNDALTRPKATEEASAMNMALQDAERALMRARIITLQKALRTGLTVMREWLNRVEIVDGRPMVDIEDVEGARQLYDKMLHAYQMD